MNAARAAERYWPGGSAFATHVKMIIGKLLSFKSGKPKHWKTFSNLDVYVPELEYILALKLFSGRRQDTRDIQALAQQLNVRTKAQAWSIVNLYIPSMQLSMRDGYITRAIDRCFTQ